jgi:hypothetical protein
MTTTHLTNPTVTINSVDFSDQCTSATVTVGFDSLEKTAFGASGRTFTKGLQSVEVSLTLFLSYGTSEVEAILAAELGEGDTTVSINAATGAESVNNPHFDFTNMMLASYTPINGGVGELSTIEVTLTGGTWVRDITPPT